MGSTEDPVSNPTKTAPEVDPKPTNSTIALLGKADFALRILLFATTVVAVVVMVTGNESKLITIPFVPLPLAADAKFNYSPALIYFVVANSVACLYSVLTTFTSVLTLYKPSVATKLLLFSAVFDALMVGIVASATGAAASIAYLGLRGNSHVNWVKVCNMYGKFCRRAGSSIIISLVSSIILVLLVSASAFSLYHRTR